jgi:hypothetical protein
MSQIIALMEFRWSKRKKKRRTRDGEIAQAGHIGRITIRPFERKLLK